MKQVVLREYQFFIREIDAKSPSEIYRSEPVLAFSQKEAIDKLTDMMRRDYILVFITEKLVKGVDY